jgi:hypothetical protein
MQGFGSGGFNAIGGAFAAIDYLRWLLPAGAARQLNREHRPSRRAPRYSRKLRMYFMDLERAAEPFSSRLLIGWFVPQPPG